MVGVSHGPVWISVTVFRFQPPNTPLTNLLLLSQFRRTKRQLVSARQQESLPGHARHISARRAQVELIVGRGKQEIFRVKPPGASP
jgi:hypothetical protein